MPYFFFKLSCGPQGFLPAKHAFCPFCHIYARARFPKIKIPEATQAKINIFCVEFQELFNAAFACQLIVRGTGFFPAKWAFFGLFQKKNLKSDFQAHCYSNVYQSSKMLYFSVRNLGMQFKVRFYHCTQCRLDAAFHVFGQKNAKKDQSKFRWGLVSASRKMLWFFARILILRAKSTLYSLLQCHSQQAWDQTYDKWYCVVTSYSHGSLTDFHEIF